MCKFFLVFVLVLFFILLKQNQKLKADQIKITKMDKVLRESERNKAVLLSHLPGMAYRCNFDKDWTMQYLSEGCIDLTGYPPEDILYNKKLSFNDLIAEEYRDILWSEWERVLCNNGSFRYEYEITDASGQKKWVLELAQGVFNEEGKVEALEGIVIDASEQKKRQSQINYLKNHDLLTGIYNRKFFEAELNRLDEQPDSLPLSILVININGLRLINDAFGYTDGDNVIKNVAHIIANCCRQKDIFARVAGDEFGIILPNTDATEVEHIQNQINQACEIFNQMYNEMPYDISIASGFGTKNDIEGNIHCEEKTAREFMYNRKLLNYKSSHSSILSSIIATLEARSQETEAHAQRITEICLMIGKDMKLSQKNLNDLQLFSVLHDIGKIGVDDRIMNKTDKLTEKEFAIIKKHPEIGYRIAMSSKDLKLIAHYILSHHERWDGKGYPQGLKGKEIPLLSRILAVADAYDAMTEDRIYRKALGKEMAIEEIKKNAGSQFDPEVVKVFLAAIENEDKNCQEINCKAITCEDIA